MEGEQIPQNVEAVFRDFKDRRAGILKALTTDLQEFFRQCDPEKENLCLYGFPGERWEVKLPPEEVPPEIPEPAMGINFARDEMVKKDWLLLVAKYSDAWLISLAFFNGISLRLDQADRKRLFNMINDLPTVFEVTAKKQQEETSSVSNPSSSKSKSSTRSMTSGTSGNLSKSQPKGDKKGGGEGLDEEEDDKREETFCGTCSEKYVEDVFWIRCDLCYTSFHGKCVNMTPTKAENVKQYKCPLCSNK